MTYVAKIGDPPWSRQEITERLDEFATIYDGRPIKENKGGMRAPHMFAVWFMAKKLSPDLIIESGVWKGQSTWLLEQACPEAKLVSIDLNLGTREYISDQAVYSNRDFSEQEWSDVTDRSLVFFDDHQNAYRRLRQCKWFGFRHIIFEDNYPISQGDCYSLKKAFANAGFDPLNSQRDPNNNDLLSKMLSRFAALIGVSQIQIIPQYETARVQPNDFDSKMLRKHLEIYYEFPPVYKTEKTRWEDEWREEVYPTPKPLLEQPAKPSLDVFHRGAMYYTWICYTRIKKGL